jgi:hypothetical protein
MVKKKMNRGAAATVTVVGVIGSIVTIFESAHVYWKCVAWAVIWTAFLYWIGTFPSIKRWRSPQKWTAGAFVTILLVSCSWNFVWSVRKKELAASMDGELHASNSNAHAPIFEIGTSGTTLEWVGTKPPMVSFAADNKMNIELVDGQILLSTEVRDEYGNELVEITRNVWRIPPGAPIVDKNYSVDALEVKDRRGHVVFQMHLLPDRVQIQGEWHGERGGGTVLMRGKTGSDLIVIPAGSKDFSWSEVNIEPMFEYPSDQHWAEWRQ